MHRHLGPVHRRARHLDCSPSPRTSHATCSAKRTAAGEKDRVRVPDVGGGFGNKFDFYGEEVIASVLSRRSGRSVKLLEDRLESFVATSQSRDAVIDATLALDQDGTIVA